jgi:hypothetical protein
MVRLVSVASGSFSNGGGDSSGGGVDDWWWPIEMEQHFDEDSYSDLSSVDMADALAQPCAKTATARAGRGGGGDMIRSAPDVYGQEHPVETAPLLAASLEFTRLTSGYNVERLALASKSVTSSETATTLPGCAATR